MEYLELPGIREWESKAEYLDRVEPYIEAHIQEREAAMSDTWPAAAESPVAASDYSDAELVKGGLQQYRVRVAVEVTAVVKAESAQHAEREALDALREADWVSWPWFHLHRGTLAIISSEQLP
jgi:hypothetical protein